MKSRIRLAALAAAAALIWSSSASAQSEDSAHIHGADLEMMEMARVIPGFGGMFYDAAGRPHVYMVDSSSAFRVKASFPDAIIHRADYDVGTLQNYRVDLRPALSWEGVVALDVDERSNRVRVSIDQNLSPGMKDQLRNRVLQLSIDPDSVIVDELPEFVSKATLRDSIRPIPAGVQILSRSGLCTLGFTVNSGTEFITNSHCTSISGGVEFTTFTQGNSGQIIGVEIVDPAFDLASCPDEIPCRVADAALGRYTSPALSSQGRIVRTTTCNTGALTDLQVNGTVAIVGTATALVGQTVTKVGRTTGCRLGQVSQTCVDVNVGGATLLCQTVATSSGPPIAAGGDSGAPVFIQSGNNAIVVGLLVAGNSAGNAMVYSAIDLVISWLF